ncbi:MAG: PDZ domain-containing protein [Thermoguttaceae bacterium]|jgi:serine protease Do|nr:PDZ domain-containing protein [Thermoguttaceae bacterium]
MTFDNHRTADGLPLLVRGRHPFFPKRQRASRGTLAVGLVLAMGAFSCLAAADLSLSEQKAFRAAVDRVAPSVVRIETVGGLERVGQVVFGAGPTTGLVVSADGYLVSSAFNFLHKPTSILVQLSDGTRKPARLVATDRNRMIVLLKIDADKPLPVPEVTPENELRVGQWAIAVGRTFEGNQPNMAVGVLSALDRVWGKAIQTDAAVSPNNYGGPLVDLHGRVLGVLVPLSPETTSELAGYEWYDSGIGFAVPLEKVLELLPRLKQGKDLLPGQMGIRFAGRALFLAEPVLSGCRPRSPAQQAGLKAGDRIVEIEGRPIAFAAQVKQELGRRYAGDKVKMAVLRDGKRLEKEVTLVDRLPPYEHPFLGVLPTRPLDTPAKPDGVRIRWVYPDSPAAKAGIRPGDVLLALAGEAIPQAEAWRSRLAERQPGESVAVTFARGQTRQTVDVALATLPEALPPEGIPPGREAHKPDATKPPASGTVQLQSLEFANEAWAYVPERYDPAVPYGVIVWMHGSAGLKEKELFAQWKPLCDRHDLILLAPKAGQASRWQLREAKLVVALLAQLGQTYHVDPARVAIAGQDSGAAMAFFLATADRETFRGIAAVEAAAPGNFPENEPAYRLAVFLARATKSRAARAIQETIARLREAKYPVTVKDLGPEPRALAPEELAELARWIDALDRF